MEDKTDKSASAVPREKKLVRSQAEHEKIKCHRINETRGEDRVVCLCDHTTFCTLPGGADEQTMKQQRPVAENDKHERNNDIQRLRPDRDRAKREVNRREADCCIAKSLVEDVEGLTIDLPVMRGRNQFDAD